LPSSSKTCASPRKLSRKARGGECRTDRTSHFCIRTSPDRQRHDGPDCQPHIRSKDKRRKLANRFKDAKDSFRIVIVRDMWLTGFDAPCLHAIYADKPMQGRGLMRAIARVNRVFRDKPGGLVVDYLGLADQLKKALVTYTASGGQGDPTFDTAQAIAVMLEKHGIACDLMHGFNWDKWTSGKPTELSRASALGAATFCAWGYLAGFGRLSTSSLTEPAMAIT